MFVAQFTPVDGSFQIQIRRFNAQGIRDFSFVPPSFYGGLSLVQVLPNGGLRVVASSAITDLNAQGKIVRQKLLANGDPFATEALDFDTFVQMNLKRDDATLVAGITTASGAIDEVRLSDCNAARGASLRAFGRVYFVFTCSASQEIKVIATLANGTIDRNFGQNGVVSQPLSPEQYLSNNPATAALLAVDNTLELVDLYTTRKRLNPATGQVIDTKPITLVSRPNYINSISIAQLDTSKLAIAVKPFQRNVPEDRPDLFAIITPKQGDVVAYARPQGGLALTIEGEPAKSIGIAAIDNFPLAAVGLQTASGVHGIALFDYEPKPVYLAPQQFAQSLTSLELAQPKLRKLLSINSFPLAVFTDGDSSRFQIARLRVNQTDARNAIIGWQPLTGVSHSQARFDTLSMDINNGVLSIAYAVDETIYYEDWATEANQRLLMRQTAPLGLSDPTLNFLLCPATPQKAGVARLSSLILTNENISAPVLIDASRTIFYTPSTSFLAPSLCGNRTNTSVAGGKAVVFSPNTQTVINRFALNGTHTFRADLEKSGTIYGNAVDDWGRYKSKAQIELIGKQSATVINFVSTDATEINRPNFLPARDQTYQVRIDGTNSPDIYDFSDSLDRDADGVSDARELVLGLNPNLKDNNVFSRADLFAQQIVSDVNASYNVQKVQQLTNQLRTQDRAEVLLQLLEEAVLRPDVLAGVKAERSVEINADASVWPVSTAPTASTISLHIWLRMYTGGTSVNTNNWLQLAYRLLLQREIDPAGEVFWAKLIDSRLIATNDFIEALLRSPEFLQTGTINAEVDQIYRVLLRRQPDSAGLSYWANARSNGLTRLAFVKAMINSAEYRARFLP